MHGRLVLFRRPPCQRHAEVVHPPAGLRNHVLVHVLRLPLVQLRACLFSTFAALLRWWSSLDSDRDGCRVSVHRDGCSAGSSPASAASPARRLLSLAPQVARFCDQNCGVDCGVHLVQVRDNIVPLFLLVVAGFLVLVGVLYFSESGCASVLLDALVSGILVSLGRLRRYSTVVAFLSPSQLAGLTFIAQDPQCTERSC